MKKLISIMLCLVMLLSLTACTKLKFVDITAWGVTNDSVDKYEEKRAEIKYAADFMPSVDDLEGYSDVSASYQFTTAFLFNSYSLTLFVEYPADIYEEKKNEALSSYDFLEEIKISSDGECYQSAPPTFEYGEYLFKTSVNYFYSDIMSACKSFTFIGVNDAKNRLAYCYFYDYHLDTFGEIDYYESEQDMITDFIDKHYEWNDLP